MPCAPVRQAAGLASRALLTDDSNLVVAAALFLAAVLAASLGLVMGRRLPAARAEWRFCVGERAGARTRDHLIKSNVLTSFFSVISTKPVYKRDAKNATNGLQEPRVC